MEIVHVHVRVKPNAIDAFRNETIKNAEKSLQEPGIARFDVIQQANDPTHFVLIEVYRTPDASGKHKETKHYKEWRNAVESMMATPRKSIKFTEVFPVGEGWG